MRKTNRQTRPRARRHDQGVTHSTGTPPMRLGDMTYLLLITVAAAILTGLLALPVTLAKGPSGHEAAAPLIVAGGPVPAPLG
ncbi:hypothetical protein SAMN04488012_1235 [Palleronia salina]|uniref:Uncharacterized protein n=1 Tax=Palleronia salina TaxID=313368 RepID=A0A1M6MB11_9RHOB|nr:hypothetical protein [Palleronia salina]SHJ80597.1 hypothetical protein SAMN04488012_1235 [Palleronia salina]